jgi:hypothetical protein
MTEPIKLPGDFPPAAGVRFESLKQLGFQLQHSPFLQVVPFFCFSISTPQGGLFIHPLFVSIISGEDQFGQTIVNVDLNDKGPFVKIKDLRHLCNLAGIQG